MPIEKDERSGKIVESQATKDALAMVDRGECTAYRAAKTQGIALSTIYRALKRRRER